MPALHDRRQPYVAPSTEDSRSPCPALNSLANHGYIPHDGRNITLTQLVSAIRHVYGLSLPFATLLAVGGLTSCGHRNGIWLALDLHDLAKHNVLEHDASLVHDNTAPNETYAPTAVDPKLLHQLFTTSDTDSLTLQDLCKAQVTRQAASPPLNSKQLTIAKGELCLIHQVFGIAAPAKDTDGSVTSPGESDELVVPKTFLEEWLGQEMLPQEWHGPLRTVGLLDLVADVRKISAAEKAFSGTGPAA